MSKRKIDAEHTSRKKQKTKTNQKKESLKDIKLEVARWKQCYLDAKKAAEALSYRISCGPYWSVRQVLDHGDCEDIEDCFTDTYCECEKKNLGVGSDDNDDIDKSPQ